MKKSLNVVIFLLMSAVMVACGGDKNAETASGDTNTKPVTKEEVRTKANEFTKRAIKLVVFQEKKDGPEIERMIKETEHFENSLSPEMKEYLHALTGSSTTNTRYKIVGNDTIMVATETTYAQTGDTYKETTKDEVKRKARDFSNRINNLKRQNIIVGAEVDKLVDEIVEYWDSLCPEFKNVLETEIMG